MSKGVHNIAFYVSPDPECSRTTQNSEISLAPSRGCILYAIYGNSTCVINHIVVTAIDKRYRNYYVSTSSGYISSLKQDSGATFQLLGVSLAAGTLLQGVVLSHYAVFSFGRNLTAPRRFVSAKPFLCWSVFHDSSACVRALFAFAFRCCASPWAVLLCFASLCLRFASLCLALPRFASLCLAVARFASLWLS